jgi:DNA polymerase (family X)
MPRRQDGTELTHLWLKVCLSIVGKRRSLNSGHDKFTIAGALQEIGTLLQLKGGQQFKARAYQRAARTVAELESNLGSLIKQDRLRSIPGVGNAIASQIREIHLTGTSSLLERLREELPRGIIELSSVPGLSVKKIGELQQSLGITSVADLKAACSEGRVRTIKGFGPKTEQKILTAISSGERRAPELHVHHALRLAEKIVDYMRVARGLANIEIAGPLRRWRETTPDVTVVAASQRPSYLLDHFARFPLVIRVTERTEHSCVAVLAEGAKASVVAVHPDQFAVALLRATGSDAHLEHLDRIAAKKKLRFKGNRLQKVSPNNGKAHPISFAAEPDIYARLGMQYLPPELREDEGEIEAALAGKLPEDLVTLDDIQGMIHCHTNYSDGKHTIEEMARGADALGMKYLTISDHSPTAFYAGGVALDRLQRQWDEIAQVQENVKVKILKATESDIRADGSLDYPDRILDQFDVIIASIHSRYRMNEDQMTHRVVTAVRQPWFKIWGHALGRLIQRRPPFESRVEEILDAAAESKAAIEINGDPYRLDMEPRWLREARKRKIKFVISTDAHSVNAMKNLKFGVGIARRGWVRRGEVLNTLGVRAFQRAVKP